MVKIHRASAGEVQVPEDPLSASRRTSKQSSKSAANKDGGLLGWAFSGSFAEERPSNENVRPVSFVGLVSCAVCELIILLFLFSSNTPLVSTKYSSSSVYSPVWPVELFRCSQPTCKGNSRMFCSLTVAISAHPCFGTKVRCCFTVLRNDHSTPRYEHRVG